MIEQLFNVIAPHRCCSCGETGEILCPNCKYDIISEPLTLCPICARPVAKTGLCSRCQPQVPFDQFWMVGERSDILKKLLDLYKFNSSRAGAQVLAELLDGVLPVMPPDVTIVGIPTHPATVRVRGFDHVELIVKALAKQRGLTVLSPLRRESSVTLHFLSKRERQKLGPELFSLSSQELPKSILLVDDILTTGTTMISAGKLLRQAGVENLYGAIIARQPIN